MLRRRLGHQVSAKKKGKSDLTIWVADRRLKPESSDTFDFAGVLASGPDLLVLSGSSTGAFYFYFKNKERIFGAALETIGEEISTALNQAIPAAEDNTLSQMKAAVESFVLYLANNQSHARILIIESSGLNDELLQVRRKIISSHRRSVEKALESISKLPNKIDSRVVSSCWVGAIHEATYNG
jgi:hypothetical protein